MKLPGMRYTDNIGKSKQVKFGGLDHRLGAADGAIWDMQNMTSDHYPLLSVRSARYMLTKLEEPGGIYAWNGLCWVDGDGFYFEGERKGTVVKGQKTFASMGPYIVIMPDKCWYNINTDTFGNLESKWKGDSLTFRCGEVDGDEAKANTVYCEGVKWSDYFNAGDGVVISGCTKHPENNRNAVIVSIDGDELQFDKEVFTLEGEDSLTEYTETGEMIVERSMPDLLYLFECENRLWGCTDRTLYVSKAQDIFNWNVHSVIASDSWALTPESAGNFTGAIQYKGYATFFKEEAINKVYGSLPSNYQLMGSATLGLAEGSGRSLAIAGETLFYLGRNGIMAYTGGIPQMISQALGVEHFENAVAGSDGLKYYVSMRDAQGQWWLYVYDTQRNLWHKEDGVHATHFASWKGNLYYLTEEGEIWSCGNAIDPPEDAKQEEPVNWMVEFADFTEADPNKKGVSRLQVRLEPEEGAEVIAYLQFDGDQTWHRVSKVTGNGRKGSHLMPIIPRRADHYRLKLTGTGGCKVHSIVRESYAGSEY